MGKKITMRPTECYECDEMIKPTDLVCNNCGTEIEDSQCSYCGNSLNEYDESLDQGTEFYLCFDCWDEHAVETGTTLEALFGEIGITYPPPTNDAQ